MGLVIGCVNPTFYDGPQVAANHAPVVVNMQPRPSFGRIVANPGLNCAPDETFIAERVEDADFDELTVRWTLLVPRDDTLDGARETLVEFAMPPLEQPVNGAFYVLPPFQLDPTTLRTRVGVNELRAQALQPEGQLLELRISDGGFKPGTDEPRDGAGFFFMSWAIELTDPDDGCGVTP